MELHKNNFALRRRVLDMVCRSKAGHIGGDFSVIDIINVLYDKVMNVSPENAASPARDRFILSKGHCVEALYAVLADKGFFPAEDLAAISTFGTKYLGHPTVKVRGVEMNTGSLGHGLPIAAGMALAGKMDNAGYRVYTVMGDGELAEGSVWEGAAFAGHYKLDNLTSVIDANGLQISGTTEEVMGHGNLPQRFSALGWHVIETDGHSVPALTAAFEEAASVKGSPTVIIAKTVKGCGVSFMENKKEWHHKVPSEAEYVQALEELRGKEANARE